MVPPYGHDPESREAFYTTLGNLAALLAAQDIVVLVPATAHRRIFRERARAKARRFLEVYIDVPPEEAARRDAKGLYAGVREGKVQNLPGIDIDYEPPLHPHVIAHGGNDLEAVQKILECLNACASAGGR